MGPETIVVDFGAWVRLDTYIHTQTHTHTNTHTHRQTDRLSVCVWCHVLNLFLDWL